MCVLKLLGIISSLMGGSAHLKPTKQASSIVLNDLCLQVFVWMVLQVQDDSDALKNISLECHLQKL